MNSIQSIRRIVCGTLICGLVCLGAVPLAAQTQAGGQAEFSQLPGYESYQNIRSSQRRLSGGGRVTGINWDADGKSVKFKRGDEKLQLNLQEFSIGPEPVAEQPPAAADEDGDDSSTRRRRRPVPRAQQRAIEISPDQKWRAIYRDFNVVLEPNVDNPPADEIIQVTTEGNERFRFGTGCWVYGEELSQDEAMWWSPDSKKLVFYQIDERHMKDYYLTTGNTKLYTKIQAVRYPKAGDDNPKAALLIYDLDSAQTERIEIDGEPMQYLYNIRFTPDGNHLLINRTNRWQDALDVLRVDVNTGQTQIAVSEQQPTWQNNSPELRFLADGQHFIWETERSGWKHYELRDLEGRLLNPISHVDSYPCQRIVKLDEEAGVMFYSAASDVNPYNLQLHRVCLDGSQHRRITSSPLNHTSFEISPDNRWVVAVREQFDTPPETVVYDESGKQVAVLAEGDRSAAEELKLPPPELFSFLADDGVTVIYGTMNKPSHFDPTRRYPLLVNVYGGPQSQGIINRYRAANSICELGFIVVKIGNRGTVGRGKAFESANYLNLGGVDLKDHVDGVRYLSQRDYIDGQRVGIYGHSYGGYLAALAVLKYPDVFQAAVAGAPVTDWKNYDTIYTERYMRTPQENPSGYNDGSCLTFTKQLQGKLMLVHGLIDDNVHPANTWQLAKQLHNADKRFEMMIYPDFKHGIGSTYNSIRWEYFHRHLNPVVYHPAAD